LITLLLLGEVGVLQAVLVVVEVAVVIVQVLAQQVVVEVQNLV